jgi:hypothetical protein
MASKGANAGLAWLHPFESVEVEVGVQFVKKTRESVSPMINGLPTPEIEV